MARRDRDDEFEEEYELDERHSRRPRVDHRDALARLTPPAICLLALAILQILVSLGIIPFVVMSARNDPVLQANMNRPGYAVGFYIGTVGPFAVPAIVNLVVAFGAYQMWNARTYGLAFTAAILACIPYCSPCLVVGMPFGLWAIIVMLDQSVKSSFSS